MSTTASNKITGLKANGYWDHPPALRLEDYALKRFGYKDYAFLTPDDGNWGGFRTVARYKCSWPEAKRRFALKLIVLRLIVQRPTT